jgi:hypothetical protein
VAGVARAVEAWDVHGAGAGSCMLVCLYEKWSCCDKLGQYDGWHPCWYITQAYCHFSLLISNSKGFQNCTRWSDYWARYLQKCTTVVSVHSPVSSNTYLRATLLARATSYVVKICDNPGGIVVYVDSNSRIAGG